MGKEAYHTHWESTQLPENFSAETLQGRKKWDDVHNVMKERK